MLSLSTEDLDIDLHSASDDEDRNADAEESEHEEDVFLENTGHHVRHREDILVRRILSPAISKAQLLGGACSIPLLMRSNEKTILTRCA